MYATRGIPMHASFNTFPAYAPSPFQHLHIPLFSILENIVQILIKHVVGVIVMNPA